MPEHYRKQLLKVHKRMEKAMKVSETTIRRILGEQKKHKTERTFFSTPGKTHTKCQNVLETQAILINVLLDIQFMNFMCKKDPSLNYF